MRKKLIWVAICLIWTMAASLPAALAEMPGLDSLQLVKMLTDKLGVTNEQASGGSGALLAMAKENLSPSDFGKVSEKIPGMDFLLKSAPQAEMSSNMKSITGALSKMSGDGQKTSQLGTLVSQFAKLGMDKGMISQFIPVILSFAQSQGGETVMNLLKGVWGNL